MDNTIKARKRDSSSFLGVFSMWAGNTKTDLLDAKPEYPGFPIYLVEITTFSRIDASLL